MSPQRSKKSHDSQITFRDTSAPLTEAGRVWRREVKKDRGLSFNFLHLFCSPLEDERVTDERMMIEQCSEIALLLLLLLLLLVRFHSRRNLLLSVIMMGILRGGVAQARAGKWNQSKFCYLSCHNSVKWLFGCIFCDIGLFLVLDGLFVAT